MFVALLVYMCIVVFIAWRLREVVDGLHIKSELTACAIIAFIAFIICICAAVVFPRFDTVNTNIYNI